MYYRFCFVSQENWSQDYPVQFRLYTIKRDSQKRKCFILLLLLFFFFFFGGGGGQF